MARQRRFPPWFSLLIGEVKNEEAFRVPDVSGTAGLSLSSESHLRLMNESRERQENEDRLLSIASGL